MAWFLEPLAAIVEPLGMDKIWVAILLTVAMTAPIVAIGIATLR